MTVLISKGCFQCFCCTEQNIKIYYVTKNEWKPNQKPRDPMLLSKACRWYTWLAVMHTRLIKSLSIIIVKWSRDFWFRQPLACLLPLPSLDHFAVNCRSFRRFKLQFYQNKTKFPVLSENAGLWAKEAGYNNALILSGLNGCTLQAL